MARSSGWTLLYFVLEYIYERFVRLIWGVEDRAEVNIEGKIAVITGANSGLGKVTALKLARRGATVIMGCRNLRQGKVALDEIRDDTGSDNVFLKQLDLSDLGSVRKFAHAVSKEFPEIHLLINNAGVYYNEETLTKTKEGHEIHMAVNHLGHFLLTNILIDNLKRAAPSRVVVVSSTNQLIANLNLEDIMLERVKSLGFQNSLPYNNSKLANSLFAMELGRRLAGTGVTTYSLCPGLVQTQCFRNFSSFKKFYTQVNLLLVGLSAEQGCETILYCALSKKCAQETGLIYRFSKHFTSANKLLNASDAFKLWQTSERLVNIC